MAGEPIAASIRTPRRLVNHGLTTGAMSLRIDRSAGIGSSRFMIYLPRKSNAHKRPVFPDWLFATVKRPRRMNCAGAGSSPAQTREAAFVSSGAARVEIGGLDLETTEEDREVGAAVCGYYARIG